MYMEEIHLSSETIAYQLVNDFIQESTGKAALANALTELEKIKIAYSSEYNYSFYSFVSVPYNYMLGNSYVVQKAEKAVNALKAFITDDELVRAHGYDVLTGIIFFTDDQGWAANSPNSNLMMALIKHAFRGRNGAININALKEILSENNSKSFIAELKLAIDKEKTLDLLLQLETQNNSLTSAVQEDTAEQVFFSGDGQMIIRENNSQGAAFLPYFSPLKAFINFMNDDYIYPTAALDVEELGEVLGGGGKPSPLSL